MAAGPFARAALLGLSPGTAGNRQTQGGTQYQGATEPFFYTHNFLLKKSKVFPRN
jgi:hypothetical protein